MKKKKFGTPTMRMFGVLLLYMAVVLLVNVPDWQSCTILKNASRFVGNLGRSIQVDWGEAGMLRIATWDRNGRRINGGLYSVEEAREVYADDKEILAMIDDVAATERKVVRWETQDEVLVGIGDTDDILPMPEALEKYCEDEEIMGRLIVLDRCPSRSPVPSYILIMEPAPVPSETSAPQATPKPTMCPTLWSCLRSNLISD